MMTDPVHCGSTMEWLQDILYYSCRACGERLSLHEFLHGQSCEDAASYDPPTNEPHPAKTGCAHWGTLDLTTGDFFCDRCDSQDEASS